jgi:hypothetical protein
MDPVPHAINVRRGDAGIANASKTHCIHGHEFTPANTRLVKNGRECWTCRRRWNREMMRRRRAK